MKNYTKLLSEQMVTVMDKYNNYEETEKIVISYGMELFLNSVLKTSIYLLIGMVAGKGVEVILAMTIFGGVRKISGGRHVETDVGCFIMTGSIIFLVAIFITHKVHYVSLVAEMIYVLQQGEITERGKHEELLSNRGIYYMLFRNCNNTDERSI